MMYWHDSSYTLPCTAKHRYILCKNNVWYALKTRITCWNIGSYYLSYTAFDKKRKFDAKDDDDEKL